MISCYGLFCDNGALVEAFIANRDLVDTLDFRAHINLVLLLVFFSIFDSHLTQGFNKALFFWLCCVSAFSFCGDYLMSSTWVLVFDKTRCTSAIKLQRLSRYWITFHRDLILIEITNFSCNPKRCWAIIGDWLMYKNSFLSFHLKSQLWKVLHQRLRLLLILRLLISALLLHYLIQIWLLADARRHMT